VFSTFFYILILFYQNLYSGLGYSFNTEVNKVNLYILSKDYNKAFSLVNLIEKKYIFRNESLYKTKVLLSVKRPTSLINSSLKSSDDYILKSFILSQINQQESSKSILREGLKLYPEKDTLTKLYELFSFISVNKLRKSDVASDENTVANKILTTKDSKWMLDLLRKNEKFLSY
jgi:hypothetical protein